MPPQAIAVYTLSIRVMKLSLKESTNCKVLFIVPYPSPHTHTCIHQTVPSAPRDVRVFTDVVVWGPPENPNGIITGYEIKFSGSTSGSQNEKKEASESYHIISGTDLSSLEGTIKVEVS